MDDGHQMGRGRVPCVHGLAYVRDAMPKEKFHESANPGSGYGFAGVSILALGIALAGIHIAAEHRRSPIAHLSKPTKLASI